MSSYGKSSVNWRRRSVIIMLNRCVFTEREKRMTKTIMVRTLNFLMISVLPLLSGCNSGGGGGGGSSVGGLFSASSGSLTLGPGPGGGGPGGGGELASIHNPEPTTMLLVGGGMMAIAYFRNRHN